MANEMDDILKDAIANTETEIFSEAVGVDLPSTEGGSGDRSVEEMGEGLEGQHEPDEGQNVEAAGEGETDGDGDGKEAGADEGDGAERDPKTGQFKAKTEGEQSGDGEKPKPGEQADGKPKTRVPLSDLTTERKARQAAEARVKELETARTADQTKAQNDFAALNRRLDDILAGRQAQPAPTTDAAAPEEIDIFENPKGFIANLESRFERQFTQKFVAADLARTHDQHGEKFEKAFAAITSLDKSDPQARAQVGRIWASATPGRDLMTWFAKQEVQRVVGDDPDAYAKRIETETRDKLAKDPEFRKQVLADLQAEASGTAPGGEGKPRTTTRMPRSLNTAAGGQSGGNGRVPTGDGSDRGVFADAFAD